MPENGKGGARPRPTYGATKVEAIPEDVTQPRSGPRPDPKFMAGLRDCIADPGGTYQVGEWKSENGAKNHYNRITKKEIKVPAGDWIFEVRRIWAPNDITDKDGNAKKWSRLYAVYEGPVTEPA